MRRERKKDNPLEEMGEDIGDIFDGGNDNKKQSGLRIASRPGASPISRCCRLIPTLQRPNHSAHCTS